MRVGGRVGFGRYWDEVLGKQQKLVILSLRLTMGCLTYLFAFDGPRNFAI